MHSSSIFVAAAALGLVCTAWAADKGPLLSTAKLEGAKVFDGQGKQIGKIDVALVEPATGIIRYGIVQVDKAWGLNDPEIAVPWMAFTVNKPGDADMSLSLDVTKEKLERAPRYKDSDADRIFSRHGSKPIYDYWAMNWWEMPGFPDSIPPLPELETTPNPPTAANPAPTATANAAKPDTTSIDKDY